MDSAKDGRPVTLVHQNFTARHVQRLRQLVESAARLVGLDTERRQHLVLAVNEAATNAIQHAGGGGQLELIVDNRRALIAQISDHGPGLPPQVPVSLPEPDALGGRGMWLIHETCDRVEFRTGETGTTVRLEMLIAAR